MEFLKTHGPGVTCRASCRTSRGKEHNHVSQERNVGSLAMSLDHQISFGCARTRPVFCSADSFLSLTGSSGTGWYFFKSIGNFSKSQS